MHIAHDVELPPSRQVLLARRNAAEGDLNESSPDHFGANLDLAEANLEPPAVPAQSRPGAIASQVVPAALKQNEPPLPTAVSPQAQKTEGSSPAKLPATGTVVLDVEEGGIEVPSFLGKSVRAALEVAQDAGLDLDAVGSGAAREQLPAPGVRVAVGSRVMVKFGR
jgi:hypothetical protein